MHPLKIWIHAARPKTLFIGMCPILISTSMAIKTGVFSLPVFLWTLLGALMIQIGTNYSNDYFDFIKGADTYLRKGPKKVLEQGLVSKKAMKTAFILCFLVAAICASVLVLQGGIALLFIALICITFSLMYTSPPFPLAYLGLGDLFVLVFYGPVATITSYYLQTHSFSLELFLISLMPGLLGLGPLTLNNLRDYEEDKQVNKKTIVVRFGKNYGKIHFALSLGLSLLIPNLVVLFFSDHFYLLLCNLLAFQAFRLIRQVYKATSQHEFQALFVSSAKLIPLYTICICLGYLLECLH